MSHIHNMKSLIGLMLFSILSSCYLPDQTGRRDVNPDHIHAVLDDWHLAASEADFDRYFSYFASDSSIFMGTDAAERWTIAEFRPWSQPYFDRGRAWDFTPSGRHLYISHDGRTAWFDEVLDTPNLGPARGSGVLIYVDGRWKIDHYNLSIPIPNEIVEDVINQIEEFTE